VGEIALAMLRGLKREGRREFTDDDLWSVIRWAIRARLQAVLLQLILERRVDMLPDGEGDPAKVKFAA
jgi:hypothetical protein